MGGTGGSDDRGRRDEESQEERIERKRREAGDQERESADGPGYTARPSDAEPEEGGSTRDDG